MRHNSCGAGDLGVLCKEELVEGDVTRGTLSLDLPELEELLEETLLLLGEKRESWELTKVRACTRSQSEASCDRFAGNTANKVISLPHLGRSQFSRRGVAEFTRALIKTREFCDSWRAVNFHNGVDENQQWKPYPSHNPVRNGS